MTVGTGSTKLPKSSTKSFKPATGVNAPKDKVVEASVQLPEKLAMVFRKDMEPGEGNQLLKNVGTIAAGTAAGTAAGFPVRLLLRRLGVKSSANLAPLVSGLGGAFAAHKVNKHRTARNKEHWRLIEEAADRHRKKKGKK